MPGRRPWSSTACRRTRRARRRREEQPAAPAARSTRARRASCSRRRSRSAAARARGARCRASASARLGLDREDQPLVDGEPASRARSGSPRRGRCRSSSPCGRRAARCARAPARADAGSPSAAALVVDHDRVAGDLREPTVDLDDRDAVRASSAAASFRPGSGSRPARASPGTCARRRAPPCSRCCRREEHHLVVRGAERLLDSSREPRVELVAEVETTTPTTRLVWCLSVRADAFGT